MRLAGSNSYASLCAAQEYVLRQVAAKIAPWGNRAMFSIKTKHQVLPL